MACAETTPTMRAFAPTRRARAGAGADARTLADRDEHHVGGITRAGLEELHPVAGHAAHQVAVQARHEVQATFGGKLRRMLARLLEVLAMLDQRGTERAHRGVLLDRVRRAARRSSPQRRDSRPRSAIDWPWLPRVALITPSRPASRRSELVQVDRTAAQLERTDTGVVLVLDPRASAEPGVDQRPAQRRRGRLAAGRRWRARWRFPRQSAAS